MHVGRALVLHPIVSGLSLLFIASAVASTYGSVPDRTSSDPAVAAKTASMSKIASAGFGLAFAVAHAPRHGVAAAPDAGDDAQSGAADLPVDAATVRVGITGRDGRVSVETLPVDEYVARVLAGEGQPRAADASQQALAIAIRTFALANRNRHGRDGFDMCDTTHCQVLRAATAASTRAALATSNRVLMHQDRPASIFYSAMCGGHPELASAVWPGAIDYGRVAADDDACSGEPGWTSEMSVREIETALRAAGLKGDRLRDLRVVQRNASGRVARLRAEGFTPDELSGQDFRMAVGRAVGWPRLRSTSFEMRRTAQGFAFAGRGSGHGVGLCVIGAGHRAAAGATADEILRFYYPGLRVSAHEPAVAERRADAGSVSIRIREAGRSAP